MQDVTYSEEVKKAIAAKFAPPEGEKCNATYMGIDIYIHPASLTSQIRDNIKMPPLRVLDHINVTDLSLTAESFAAQDDNLVQDIMDFVKNTFPMATRSGQYIKLTQEMVELSAAELPEERAEELADIIFVAIGLATVTGVDIVRELRNKLERNKSREWIYMGNGVYQHRKE